MNRKRLKSYGWLVWLIAFTSCDPWNLTHLGTRQSTGPTSTTTTTSSTNLLDGLIAYYPFSSSMLDASGNNLHGQSINGATYGPNRMGISGLALLLDGIDDYVEVPDNTKLQPDALSVSVWIKPKKVLSSSHIYTKSEWAGDKNLLYDAYIRPHTAFSSDCCEIHTNINQDGVCSSEAKIARLIYYDPTYVIDRWYHIVTVFEGKTGKLYINGELRVIQTDRLPNPIEKCSGGKLRFGASYDGDENYFNGTMDEIRLYNRALTDADVQALYKL